MCLLAQPPPQTRGPPGLSYSCSNSVFTRRSTLDTDWKSPQRDHPVCQVYFLRSSLPQVTGLLHFLPLHNEGSLWSSFQKHLPRFPVSPHWQLSERSSFKTPWISLTLTSMSQLLPTASPHSQAHVFHFCYNNTPLLGTKICNGFLILHNKLFQNGAS